MSETRCTSTRKPAVGDTVIDRAFSDLYGVDKATPMKVTRILKPWRDGVDELEVTLTYGDGEESTDLAFSDEVYVVTQQKGGKP
jgi:hypothetical protein